MGFDGEIRDQEFLYLVDIWVREVQVWPWGGTYWRGSFISSGFSILVRSSVSFFFWLEVDGMYVLIGLACQRELTSHITQLSNGWSAGWSNSVPHATHIRLSWSVGD